MPGLHASERVEEYTREGWWTDETMDQLLRERVAQAPARLALVDPLNKIDLTGSAPLRLTWTELDAAVDQLAAILLRSGIAAGDVLGVQLPNTVELAVVYLACWRIGVIVSPLPVAYREREITLMATAAGFRGFVTAARIGAREHVREVAELKPQLPDLAVLLGYGEDLPAAVVALPTPSTASDEDTALVQAYAREHPADPNDCVTICWTSGTESVPKGVPRCHYDWLAMSWATVEAPSLGADDVLLNPFPMVNMAGINGMFLPWLRTGSVLVQHQPFDLAVFLEQVRRERVTYTVAPPALLTMLLADERILAGADISSLRVIGSGSSPLTPSMVAGWQDRHGIGVINFFGSNEGIALLTDPRDVPDPFERASYFPRYGVPGIEWSARISRSTKVRLVDENGDDVTEAGRPGELRLKGPSVFAGYLNGDGLASPFDDRGYLKTGDVFVIAGPDGRYLQYVDRSKDLIIRGGMNIAPAELEALIADHPAVADVAVVGQPDEVLGERVCAVVCLKPEHDLTLGELVDFLRRTRIASYKLPESLELRSALPRNPVGKVLKRQIRDELRATNLR